jgi:hypothetical protein
MRPLSDSHKNSHRAQSIRQSPQKYSHKIRNRPQQKCGNININHIFLRSDSEIRPKERRDHFKNIKGITDFKKGFLYLSPPGGK